MTDTRVHGMKLTAKFVPRVNIFAMRKTQVNRIAEGLFEQVKCAKLKLATARRERVSPKAAPLVLLNKRRPKTPNLDTEAKARRKACIALEYTARAKLTR